MSEITRTPSAARIAARLGISAEKATEIRDILKNYEGAALWSDDECGATWKALDKVDRVLGTHGREYIRGSAGSLTYCNTGDPYTPTIGRTWTRRRGWSKTWFLGCWGTLVETGAVIGETS